MKSMIYSSRILLCMLCLMLLEDCSRKPENTPVSSKDSASAPFLHQSDSSWSAIDQESKVLHEFDTMNIPMLDSNIHLGVLPYRSSNRKENDQIDLLLAKNTLNNHFRKKKGYVIEGESSGASLTAAKQTPIEITFDTMFKAFINNDSSIDAIVAYWAAPLHASDHCFQPQYALLVSTDAGYVLTKESIVPGNFYLISAENRNGIARLRGYDYDCFNSKYLRKFTISLQ